MATPVTGLYISELEPVHTDFRLYSIEQVINAEPDKNYQRFGKITAGNVRANLPPHTTYSNFIQGAHVIAWLRCGYGVILPRYAYDQKLLCLQEGAPQIVMKYESYDTFRNFGESEREIIVWEKPGETEIAAAYQVLAHQGKGLPPSLFKGGSEIQTTNLPWGERYRGIDVEFFVRQVTPPSDKGWPDPV